VVPTAPKVRSAVAPVLPPGSKPPTRPVLEPEEGLRDVILSSLNAVFEGAGGGETFQGIGKVDIHLRITQGEVFISEVKFWDGPDSVREVIKQLRGRLTCPDSYGVALVLSRNARFTEVLQGAREAIASADGFVSGTLQEKGANHFVARLTTPSDEARQAHIHVLLYNLYLLEPGRRALRRALR